MSHAASIKWVYSKDLIPHSVLTRKSFILKRRVQHCFRCLPSTSDPYPTLQKWTEKSEWKRENTIIVYYSFFVQMSKGKRGIWSLSGSPLNLSLVLISKSCFFTEAKLNRIPFLTVVSVSDESLTHITVGHACRRMALCYRITGASSMVVGASYFHLLTWLSAHHPPPPLSVSRSPSSHTNPPTLKYHLLSALSRNSFMLFTVRAKEGKIFKNKRWSSPCKLKVPFIFLLK